MTRKMIERAAYAASHRILKVDTTFQELACPGARRSRAVDTIADIIRQEFELHNSDAEEPANWPLPKIESGQYLVNRRRGAVVALRASSC
jgi:hypothetical protein